VAETRTIRRFGRTERAVHWVHAAAFLVLLATGLVLLVPDLSEIVARRPLVKNVHLLTALAWAAALVAILLLGDRRRLAALWREAEAIDADDRRWLRGRRAPQGRLNAGQKLNVLVTAAFAVLLAVSGVFLWLGERDHTFLLDGAGTVHDVVTYASIVLVTGHLYFAVVHPATRHSLRGIVRGDVHEAWAERHHPKWVAAERERAD
jgi:formate dehydrogenase subunit gamma